ncbi:MULTISPECIES: hypothetical protein [unclassified Rhodococcus (in: high G+C Gram-positive bacteria)]|nr:MULTISPECIES: hypothetical protein [unclassified Rhodococcus (in: high G+C Gram-positive bacteria)]
MANSELSLPVSSASSDIPSSNAAEVCSSTAFVATALVTGQIDQP